MRSLRPGTAAHLLSTELDRAESALIESMDRERLDTERAGCPPAVIDGPEEPLYGVLT